MKPMEPVPNPEQRRRRCSLAARTRRTCSSSSLTSPQNAILVPPATRTGRFVSKKQYKDIFKAGSAGRRPRLRPDRPGPGDRLQRRRRLLLLEPGPGHAVHRPRHRLPRAARSSPRRQLASDGNIDDPQFKWLRGAAAGGDRGRPAGGPLQPPRDPESLTADAARRGWRRPALLADAHGHDINPGCDLDPRSSHADPPRGRHGQPPARIPQRDRLGRRPQPRQRSSTPSRTRAGRAASGASASPPRPTGRSRPACSRSSTTTTARSRSSARSSTTSARRPRRRRAPPAAGARTSTTSPRSAARCPSTTSRPAAAEPIRRRASRRPQRRAADRRPALSEPEVPGENGGPGGGAADPGAPPGSGTSPPPSLHAPGIKAKKCKKGFRTVKAQERQTKCSRRRRSRRRAPLRYSCGRGPCGGGRAPPRAPRARRPARARPRAASGPTRPPP